MLKNNKKRFLSIFLLAALMLVSLNGCLKGGTQAAQDAYKPVTLTWWRTWDDQAAVSDLITAYQALHPNVTIQYRKFRYEEYEQALLNAMAEDRGPDVFSISNTWMQKYQPRLLPLPSQTTLPIKSLQGTIKKEEVVNLVTTKALTLANVKSSFLDVVAGDVLLLQNVGTAEKPTYAQKVFGLPLSVDTLVMYYNKNLLNNAGIAEPAKTWQDFQSQVKQITKIDNATGNILIAGAGIGTANNVVRSFDIISLLMMQNMATMIDSEGYASFDKIPRALGDVDKAPGVGALEYYTQFASPLFEGYCWNKTMPSSLTAFTSGKLGYFFGYAYQRDTIRTTNPQLNFGVASVPQVGEQQKVNYANYWVETVSRKTKNVDYAWDFVQFITNEQNVVKYLSANGKPTALRSTKLINQQLADENLAPFAGELLTAKSWYKGNDENGAEGVFADMINNVLGGLDAQKAVTNAAARINLSIQARSN